MAKLGRLEAMMVVGSRHGKSAIHNISETDADAHGGRRWAGRPQENRKPARWRTGTVLSEDRPGPRRAVEYRVRVAFDRELEMELNEADGEGWIVVALWRNVANSGGVESTTVVWGRLVGADASGIILEAMK